MGASVWCRSATLAFVVAVAVDCKGRLAMGAPREPGTRPKAADKIVESIYQSGYQGDWVFYGWADRVPHSGGPEKLKMGGYGGWIINNSKLKGAFGGVVFRFKAPPSYGDFLQVRLESDVVSLPAVKIGPEHRRDLDGDWSEVFVSMSELDPTLAPFKQVILRAHRPLPEPGVIEFEGVGLTASDPKLIAAVNSQPGVPATFTVDCSATPTPISPLVYGIAFSAARELASEDHWHLNPTARRWGGNAMTRFNWELGNVRNTGSDWYFENRAIDVTWTMFLTSNLKRSVQSALTMPTIGWVAKDTRSSGFPVSELGRQQQVDEGRGAGNGMNSGGKPIPSGPPTRTSVAAPPEFIGRWVKAIKKLDQESGARTVHMYILDNEPALWHDTHRDVHPAPLTYDELLERTVKYASAIRQADPDGIIAGPAEWGWPAYTYSAADGVAGFSRAPDRKAHGNIPLIEWYLQKLAEHEKKTGVRLLDVVDLHFYPQAKGVGVDEDGETDKDTNALRIRSTRGLWDPTYTDESWIKEPVQLIPRMRGWVDRNYPGLKLSIGEYSFGAEKHMSGGLALAEALGRFGQQGLYSAFYWTYPTEGTPAFWAFRAFRNYDGKGATFESLSLPAQAPASASAFAARSADGRKATVVLLNFSPADALEATVTLKGCPTPERQRVFSFSGDPVGFAEQKAPLGKPYRLPRYSINVVELSWPKEEAKKP